MNTFQEWSLGIALVGAVLGIFNFWVSFLSRRVKLRVSAGSARIVMVSSNMPEVLGPPRFAFMITVVNLSAFPVVIKEVGFTCGRRGDRGRFRVYGSDMHGKPRAMPCTINPRHSVAFYLQPKSFLSGIERRFGRSFAETVCGSCRRGNRYRDAYLNGVEHGSIPVDDRILKIASKRRKRLAEARRAANIHASTEDDAQQDSANGSREV